MTLLFFFWVYGIVSFGFDLKNKFVPAVRRYKRRRAAAKRQAEADEEREERKEQLL
jgi:hypothetical protein